MGEPTVEPLEIDSSAQRVKHVRRVISGNMNETFEINFFPDQILDGA
jgi:hypothetical protein